MIEIGACHLLHLRRRFFKRILPEVNRDVILFKVDLGHCRHNIRVNFVVLNALRVELVFPLGELGIYLFLIEAEALFLPRVVICVRGVDLISNKLSHLEVFQRLFRGYIIITFRVIDRLLGGDIESLIWVRFNLDGMHCQEAIVSFGIGQALLVAIVIDELHLATFEKELFLGHYFCDE